MSNTDPAVTAFRHRNRQCCWAATVALALVAAVVAMTLGVVTIRGHLMQTLALRQLPLAWTPALFYLWALWSTRQMFATLSRGGFVFHAVSTALGHIGWALGLGAVATLVIGTALLVAGPHVTGGFVLVNVPAVTLGIVGLALIITARMMRRAQTLERRVESLNAALEDFI